MSGIRSGVGLVSGINTESLVKSLMAAERRPMQRLQKRVQGFRAVKTALKGLETRLLTMKTSVQQFGESDTFNSHNVSNSRPDQLKVTAGKQAVPGTYRFQTVREAGTHQLLSRGFANADEQTVGTGTLTIATGGDLETDTRLDLLNGGNGVRRGVLRITDRSGRTADVDLSDAFTMDEVVRAINRTDGIDVSATTRDGRLVVTDTSGSTAENLTIADVDGGHTAEDLGIAKSVSSSTLTGETVYYLSGDFTLDQINDGNGVHLADGAPDLRITLSDETVLDVDLNGASTLNGVVEAINDHADNGGKLSAALVDGHLELTDQAGGAGTLQVEDINTASAVRALGLDTAAADGKITGRRLLAGLDSVLLHNLRGGRGIDQTGQITLTDRAGTSATVDLTGAESLDEVLTAINSARSSDGTKLQLTADVNEAGTGIEVRDTSGSTASNLVIDDVDGTLAAQLGIQVDAARDSVDSGPLHRRHVNEATSLEDYAPDGGAVEPGSFRITDSAGNSAVIKISSAVETIGDALVRINAASDVAVRAELNKTGDGLVLIDEAGGSDPLEVEAVEGETAADLRLLGKGTLGDDGQYRIQSRRTAVVDVGSEDTLDDVVRKINEATGTVRASVFDDGSAVNSHHLVLKANSSGAAHRLFIEETGLDLGLTTVEKAEDALLRMGGGTDGGFLLASETNAFDQVLPGIDVDVRQAGPSPAEVTVTRDHGKIEQVLQKFVDGYNKFIESVSKTTKFDPETEERGVLQGEGVVLRAQNRLDSLINRRFGSDADAPVRSLVDLGIRMGEGGKLEFDKDRLAETLQRNPQAVEDFFLEKESGFAAVAEKTFESLTEPSTGMFATRTEALNSSIESAKDRVEDMKELLAMRKERLFRRFIRMENALGRLSAQQRTIQQLPMLSRGGGSSGLLSAGQSINS